MSSKLSTRQLVQVFVDFDRMEESIFDATWGKALQEIAAEYEEERGPTAASVSDFYDHIRFAMERELSREEAELRRAQREGVR